MNVQLFLLERPIRLDKAIALKITAIFERGAITTAELIMDWVNGWSVRSAQKRLGVGRTLFWRCLISCVIAATPFVTAAATPFVTANEARAQTYFRIQAGGAFAGQLTNVTALENLNYPGPPNARDTLPSTVSAIDLNNSAAFGLKFGRFFANHKRLGIELDIFRYTPDFPQQDVFIDVEIPAEFGGGTLQVAEDQLPADIGIWVFNPSILFRFNETGRLQPYVGVGPAFSLISARGDGTSCRNLADIEQFGEFVNECPAPDFKGRGFGIGVLAKAGITANLTPRWAVFAEYKYLRNGVNATNFRSLLDIDGRTSANVFVSGLSINF